MRQPKRFVFLFVMMILLLQACSLPSTGTPTPTSSAPLTLYVSTTGRDTNNCTSPTSACLTLYQALSLSTPGSTINVGAGTFNWVDPPFTPRYDLTLAGAGVGQTTLSRSAGDVIQIAYPATVTIRDLTILGNNPNTGGGNGVEIRAGVNLALSNCHIHGKYWGLRLLTGATATVNNCTFDGNSYGIENFGNLTMSASTFSMNQVAMDNQGVAQVQTTVFDHNGDFDPASRAGAPTITNSQGGHLTLTGGSISNGGSFGLIIEDGTALLEGVNVHDNAGVAVWEQQGSMEIRSSVIQDNGSYGLEIGGRSGATGFWNVNVHETAIVRNGSAGIRMDGGTVIMQNDTVSGNRANSIGDGGGIWMYGGALIMLDSTVAYNTGHGITAYPGDVPGAIAVRRTVVALNSSPCMIDGRIHTSYDTAAFMCVDSFTPATLGLGPLTPAAGTVVHPLLAGSPLIDASRPVSSCPAIDQRGYARPVGASCDIGAFEFGAGAYLTAATPATDKSTPTLLQIATDTPAASLAAQVIPNLNAYCRKGPGTSYDQVTVLQKGMAYNSIGRNSLNSWWQIQVPGKPDCWVGDANVDKQGPVEQLSIVPPPPLPGTPSKFVNSFVCDIKMKSLVVSLNWATVPGVTGYRLYRNGDLLVSVEASTITYSDNAPLGADLVYEVEAFNTFGVAPRLSTTVPACK
jgi:hypothetical protein